MNKKPKCPICNDTIVQIRLYCRVCMNLLQKYEMKEIKMKDFALKNCEKCTKKWYHTILCDFNNLEDKKYVYNYQNIYLCTYNKS